MLWNDNCDYPEFGHKVAHAVADGECERGILICGTGIGISISANKVKGIRAALCHDCFSAEATRLHNDANILAMGARVLLFARMIKHSHIYFILLFHAILILLFSPFALRKDKIPHTLIL